MYCYDGCVKSSLTWSLCIWGPCSQTHFIYTYVEMGVVSKDCRVLVGQPPLHLRASRHRRGCPAAWDLGLPTGSGAPQLMNIHEGGLAPTGNSCASISRSLLCLLSVGKEISASAFPFLPVSGLENPEDNHRAVSACQQTSQQLVGMAKELSKCCDGL